MTGGKSLFPWNPGTLKTFCTETIDVRFPEGETNEEVKSRKNLFKIFDNVLKGVLKISAYTRSLAVLTELFGRDYQFALATSKENVPSVRVIDTYYDDCAFYMVTYAKSRKTIEMSGNNKVALCNKLYRFNGTANLLGHPLKDENRNIRSKLIEAFSPWYFKHNDENDENMCYVKIELDFGFFYKDGTGYKVDFHAKTAEEFPFEFDVVTID